MFENTTFNPGPSLVRDGRTLLAMAKQGKIFYPVHKGQKYVEYETNGVNGRISLPWRFDYHGKSYTIRYLDGCFYPFVFKAC